MVFLIFSCNQNQDSNTPQKAIASEPTGTSLIPENPNTLNNEIANGGLNDVPSNETDENETDENETDENETDENETDENETDENEADSNEDSCSTDTDKDGAMNCIDESPYNSNCYVNCTSSSSSTTVTTTNIDPNAPYYKYYKDDDGDGFGNSSSSMESTQQKTGYVLDSSDCDDGDKEIGSKTTDEDCDGALSDSNDSNKIDCDDTSTLFGAKKNDADCDGVLATMDCDDTNALLKLDDSNDTVCDELQFFYDTDYQVQVLVDNVWQYWIIEEKNYLGYAEYYLRRADSSSFTFQFRLATDQTFKTTAISSDEVLKNEMKGSYIYSSNKKTYMSTTYTATYLITMGNPTKSKGSGLENIGYVDIDLLDAGAGDYLISTVVEDCTDTCCPAGKLCSQEFRLKYTKDGSRWFAKDSTLSDSFGRDMYSTNALKLRLIKDAPSE